MIKIDWSSCERDGDCCSSELQTARLTASIRLWYRRQLATISRPVGNLRHCRRLNCGQLRENSSSVSHMYWHFRLMVVARKSNLLVKDSSCVFFLSRRLTSQGVPDCPILCSSFQFTVISQFCSILEIIVNDTSRFASAWSMRRTNVIALVSSYKTGMCTSTFTLLRYVILPTAVTSKASKNWCYGTESSSKLRPIINWCRSTTWP